MFLFGIKLFSPPLFLPDSRKNIEFYIQLGYSINWINYKDGEIMEKLLSKHVSDSEIEQIQPVFAAHLNSDNRLFGGQLVAWIDIVAGAVAQRHSNQNVTTAAIDNLQFKAPVPANSLVVLRGKLTCVGKTSMEVRVDSFVEDLSGKRTLVNTAYLVLVALDKNDKPTPVPRLICDTPEEKAEWEAGQKRRRLRQDRRMKDY
jgi:acyl-CoA hydrolase